MMLLNQYKCIAGYYRIITYPIEMKSLFRSLVERMSSSLKSSAAAATTAPVALGRWGIQYDKQIIDRKIIQANEDHCGCCVAADNNGVVSKKKKLTEAEAKKNSSVVRYEKREEYLLPYVV